MPKFKFSTFNIYIVYLVVLVSFFIYAGISGTRILGDDKEEYKPEGVQTGSGSHRVYRTYHK